MTREGLELETAKFWDTGSCFRNEVVSNCIHVHSSTPSRADIATEATGTNKAFRSPEQKFDAPAPNPCFTALLDADSDCSALTANTLAHTVLHSI